MVDNDAVVDGAVQSEQRVKADPDILHELFDAPQSDGELDEMTGDVPADIVAHNELNTYKRFRLLPIGDNESNYNDPLAWWKMHEHTLPFLAKLARKTLNVPASSAPSERVFSSAGIYVSKRRARLRSDIVEATVFLHGCWRRVEAYLRDCNDEADSKRVRKGSD